MANSNKGLPTWMADEVWGKKKRRLPSVPEMRVTIPKDEVYFRDDPGYWKKHLPEPKIVLPPRIHEEVYGEPLVKGDPSTGYLVANPTDSEIVDAQKQLQKEVDSWARSEEEWDSLWAQGQAAVEAGQQLYLDKVDTGERYIDGIDVIGDDDGSVTYWNALYGDFPDIRTMTPDDEYEGWVHFDEPVESLTSEQWNRLLSAGHNYDEEMAAEVDKTGELYWGRAVWEDVKDTVRNLGILTDEEREEHVQYLMTNSAFRLYLEMGGKLPTLPDPTGEGYRHLLFGGLSDYPEGEVWPSMVTWQGLGDPYFNPPTAEEAAEQSIQKALTETQVAIKEEFLPHIILPGREYTSYYVTPGEAGEPEEIAYAEGSQGKRNPSREEAAERGLKERRIDLSDEEMVDNPYAWIYADGAGNPAGKWTKPVFEQIQAKLKGEPSFILLSAEEQEDVLEGKQQLPIDPNSFIQDMLAAGEDVNAGLLMPPTGSWATTTERAEEREGRLSRNETGEIVQDPTAEGFDKWEAAYGDEIPVAFQTAEEQDSGVAEDAVETAADPAVEPAADAGAAVAEEGPRAGLPPHGNLSPQGIDVATYDPAQDPTAGGDFDYNSISHNSWIVREFFGLQDVTGWENERTDPFGQVFGNAIERYGWTEDENGDGIPDIVEYAIWALGQNGLTDVQIEDQKRAGWLYYNPSAAAAQSAGVGGAVSLATTGAPGALTTGGSTYGSDGQGGHNGNYGGTRNIPSDDTAYQFPWIRDLRGHTEVDQSKSYELEGAIGDAASFWVPYVPAEFNPDSIYVGVANALLPFLSQTDKKGLGAQLYNIQPEAFPNYQSILGALYGLEGHESYFDPARFAGLLQTLYNLKTQLQDVPGYGTFGETYGKDPYGENGLLGLDWLIGAVKLLKQFGDEGMTTDMQKKEFKRLFEMQMNYAAGMKFTGYSELFALLSNPYLPNEDSFWETGPGAGSAEFS